ncbi:MAG: hypothetical protein PHD06_04395 [Bacteroidales bacterium]|jgi:hypothetical protein|nr:hypothetical protein [Bacteroidales bacterium]MDY0197769.1 hypothetical protein [Tenuifilaceae bacterium]
MKNYKYLTTFMLFSFVLFCSCNSSFKNETESNTIDTLLARKITFPTKLSYLKSNSFYPIDTLLTRFESEIKVISIVDGSCMKCITNQINRLDSLFTMEFQNFNDTKLIFVLNVSMYDSSFFMRNLYPEIRTSGALLWDNSYHFERENRLFTQNEYLRTFMVDAENRIVVYGNPLMNPELLDEYKKRFN